MKKLYNKILEYREIISYLIAGVLTTLVSIVSYNIFRFILGYMTSTVLSWIVAVLFAYVINRKYVFKSKNNNLLVELIKFIGCRLFTLLVEMLSMYLLVETFKVNDRISKIIVQIIIIVLNYVLSKLIAFKKQEKEK